MSDHRPSYREVLRTPSILRSFLPSIIGRLSLATSGLALVLLLEEASGSFVTAGAVTAALAIANVVSTPWRSRLIDRMGQTVPLAALSLAHAASLVALGFSAMEDLPLLLLLGVLAGVSAPPFGATMRVLWSVALPPGGPRNRAFSIDAVAEEVTFTVGPLVAALLAVVVDPFASLLLSATCVAVGAALFIASPLSRRQRGSHKTARTELRPYARPLRSRGFPPIVIAMSAPGVILGSIEIAAPAVAESQGDTLLSGVLLALFAGTSAVGGLLYGRLRLRSALEEQLLALTLGSLVALAATGLIGGVAAALVGFMLTGLFLAPQLIVGYLGADARTDPRVRTEASSWINTAVNLGAALGAALFGACTDVAGPDRALVICVVVAGVIITTTAPWLLRPRHPDGP